MSVEFILESSFPTLSAAVEDFKKSDHLMDDGGYLIEGYGGERVHPRAIQYKDTVGLNVYEHEGAFWYEICPAFTGTNVSWSVLEQAELDGAHDYVGIEWFDPDWIEKLD